MLWYNTIMEKKTLKISQIKQNGANPRTIRDANFDNLVQSIIEFPEMLEAREIVVNTDYMILGGNMRYKAAKAAGVKEVPVKIVDWPEERQNEFIIKDNVSGGDWDWEMLANQWEQDLLEHWGLEIEAPKEDNNYTRKIEAPIYKPTGPKPHVSNLYDDSKYVALVREIDDSDLSDEDKEFLKLAASRHIVFDYANIAEYYANSDAAVQKVMENSALVIIDYQKAIENGFVKLTEDLAGEVVDEIIE